MKDERDKLHLLHIRDAIDQIQKYCHEIGFEEFSKGETYYDAVLMRFVVLGEAVNSLSDEFREKHSHLPWDKAVAIRNRTVHAYSDIKPEVIWKTAKEDLPELKKDIEDILNS